MNSSKKVLIVLGYDDGAGGISNYFNVLGLNLLDNIDYFIIYKTRSSGIRKATDLIRSLASFYLKIKRYDTVHINVSMNPKSFFRESMFACITKFRQAKLVLFWHGWDENLESKVQKKWLLKTLFNKSFARSDGMITLSRIFSNKLIELGAATPRSRYYLTTPPVETGAKLDSQISAKLCAKHNKPLTLLFLSRLEASKGIFIVLEAFNDLQKFSPIELRLHIAGEGGDLVNARQYVKEAKLSNVTFHGHISGSKKHEILLDSDLLFFPTCYPEGLPTVILEGMYYGLIIVTRDVAGISEHVFNDINGFVTDSKSPQLFSDKILTFIKDRDLCHKMAITNHQQAREHYSKATVTDTLQKVYSEV